MQSTDTLSRQDADVVIVGGGITGLTAAYRLRQQSDQLRIALVESSDRLGGKIQTERQNGFTIEAGPDCFLSRKMPAVTLCRELGIANRLVGRLPATGSAYVYHQGELHPLPEGLSGFIPTNLDALYQSELLSTAGVERVRSEATLPAAEHDDDESVGHFVRRRFGDEAFEHLIEPLMGGIYAGQADQLSLAATFPQLRQLELRHGSLTAGLHAAAGNRTTSNDLPPFVSLPNGMQELSDRLAEVVAADCDVKIETRVGHIRPHPNGGWLIEADDLTLTAGSVIVTTPAPVTAALFDTHMPEIAAPHRGVAYASTALINLAFCASDVPSLPAGYGYVVPRAADRSVLACTWSSQKWAARAPASHVLIRVYIGRYAHTDVDVLTDDELLEMAQAEAAEMLGFTAAPQFSRIFRWPKGLPQYNLGHLERVATIRTVASNGYPGLFFAGAAYDGVGIPDCIASAEKAVAQVVQLRNDTDAA